LIVSARPMISGRPPNRARHQRALMTATLPSDAFGDRPNAQAGEIVGRHHLDFTCGLYGAVHRNAGSILEAQEADNVGKDLVLSADGVEHVGLEGPQHGFSAPGFSDFAIRVEYLQQNEAVRVVHWQRANQQVIDEAEERGIGADAECERDRHDGREGPGLPQHPHGVAQVLGDHVETRHSSLLPVHFAQRHQRAEFEQRLAPRVGRRQTAAPAVVDEQLEMRGQLFVEFTIELRP
jgi:hypothetical protein